MKAFFNILKYITAFAGFAGVIWGVFELVDTLRDNDAKQTEFHEEVVVAIRQNSAKSDSILNLLVRTNERVDQNTDAINTYQRATRYYIEHQAELTREQQIDLFDYFTDELKKNENIRP